MLAKRIIPCLDVDRGRVVKGINFVGLRDAGDPVEIARRYNEQGADELTFLDITASSDERDLILHVVEEVAAQVFIPLTVGGGVRKVEDVRRLLNAGADKVSINTAAVQNPQLVADAAGRYGAQCIVVAIDAKQTKAAASLGIRWEVFTHGGRRPAGLDAVGWARKMQTLGAGEILLTSMDRDGTREGFDLALTRAVAEAVDVPVTARVSARSKQTKAAASLGIRWEVFTHGGRRPAGLDAVGWARKMQTLGAGEILLTSMDRDGTREGFDLALTRAVAEAVDVPVTARVSARSK